MGRRKNYDRYGNPTKSSLRASKKLNRDDDRAIKRAVSILSDVYPKVYEFPFPSHDIGLMEILDSTLPDDIIEARDKLAVTDLDSYRLLVEHYTTRLTVDNTILVFSFSKLQAYYPYNDFGKVDLQNGRTIMHTIDATSPYYYELSDWAKKVSKLRADRRITINLLDHCLLYCNTSGQLAAAWPELIQFMPSDLADSLRRQARGSRLPTALDILRVNDERHTATEFLALMAMMKDVSRPVKVKLL